MAFGITSKYAQDFSLGTLTADQFLVIAIEAAKKLDWNISYTSETGFTAFTKFSMRSWSEEVKVIIEGGNASLRSACTGTQVTDWGKNKENIENLVAAIDELKNTFTPEELAQKYDMLKSVTDDEEQDVQRQQPLTANERTGGFLEIFKPTAGYFITPILINLNIAIYILMVIAGVNFLLPDNESLLNWGANFRPATLAGQPWRLITCCFLHIGIFHLLMNMYALLYIGLLLEPYLGKTKFLTAYLLTGLIASMASLWWNNLIISAGASGAIFGMYGVFLAMLTTNLIEKSARKALLISIVFFVGYNILNGLKPNSGIDNAAHLGGLLGGLAIGYAMIPGLKTPDERKLKYGTVGILIVLVISASAFTYNKISNDIVTYESKMDEFIGMESMALEVYNISNSVSKDKLLYEISDRGIYYWKENIKLIDSFDDLELPAEIRTRNRLLKEYCELRIKSYELIYKAILFDTDKYKTEIENYNKQIEAKMKDLGGGKKEEGEPDASGNN